MTEQITFEVETSRVLEILSKEIYDSPLALLRENLQNAYDAVLMRCVEQELPLEEGRIDIQLHDDVLLITDNGIGMSEQVLRESFWKAGSSGKRTDLAKRSGVIGTFGIGAMANFGVATQLRVETRFIESDETLVSIADRCTLSIAKECIQLSRLRDDRGPGTAIHVTLDPQSLVTPNAAKSYLVPYIRFLPVAVHLNGELISQSEFDVSTLGDVSAYSRLSEHQASGSMIPTTTLVTKDRIFVPVPAPLVSEFRISEGSKEFYVRFDTVP